MEEDINVVGEKVQEAAVVAVLEVVEDDEEETKVKREMMEKSKMKSCPTMRCTMSSGRWWGRIRMS